MFFFENSVLKEKMNLTGNNSKTKRWNSTKVYDLKGWYMKVKNAIKKEIARVDFTQSVFAYLYPFSK